MKADDLLLDDDERTAAWNEGVESGRADWAWAGAEAVARAQAAKVLAVLVEHSGDAQAENIERWVRETGLTWPPKEG